MEGFAALSLLWREGPTARYAQRVETVEMRPGRTTADVFQELYDDMQKEHKFETGKVIVHHWSLTPNVLFPEKA